VITAGRVPSAQAKLARRGSRARGPFKGRDPLTAFPLKHLPSIKALRLSAADAQAREIRANRQKVPA